MKKAFEIRLYPNKEQRTFFNKTFGCCRFVYNHCLWMKSCIYEETYMNFNPNLRSFKEEWEWLKEADSQGLANAYMDNKKAYQSFFDGKTKYPKYKRKTDKQSYRNAMMHSDINELIVGNKIIIPKVGPVSFRQGYDFHNLGITKVWNITVNYAHPKGCELVMLPMLPWQAYSTIGWLTCTLPSRFSEYRRAAS